MAETNGIQDLLTTIRKYIVPKFAGGGYTKEEQAEITKNLEKAEETAKNKTTVDYGKDVVDIGKSIFGVPLTDSSGQWLIVGIVVFVFVALFKD